MRRLFALALSALLVFGFAPVAKADVAGLTPCAESARFQQRASAATTDQAKARFEMYSQAVCGEDGLPHLIVDDNAKERRRLSQVLREHNSSLKTVLCVPPPYGERHSHENQQIQYYTLLNRFGRGRVRSVNCSRHALVETLRGVTGSLDLQRKQNGVLNVLYGILHEVPMMWST